MKEQQIFNHELARTARIVMALRIILRPYEDFNNTGARDFAWGELMKEGLVDDDGVLSEIPIELWVLINNDIGQVGVF